jgi:hypothetical protein
MLNWKMIGGALAGAVLMLAAGGAGADDAPARGEGMQPGLGVNYYYGDFGHVDEVVEFAGRKDATPGDPLPKLDYRGGEGKAVLNQKHKNLVGVIITGFINFTSSGTHQLQIRSNDGIRIAIGGLTVYEAPEPHPNLLSDPVPVQVSEAGWLPIEIVYYERKGSWAIELMWQQNGKFVAIPETHFAH